MDITDKLLAKSPLSSADCIAAATEIQSLRDKLAICRQEAELAQQEHLLPMIDARCQTIAKIASSADSEQGTQFMTGSLDYEGLYIKVNFQVPIGASVIRKDAAFLAALAQQAHIDYLAIGEAA